MREIKVHARLSHPNLVSFYGAAEIDHQVVVTSEHFEGASLQKRLLERSLPINEVVAWMLQVLAGLDYAHEHGVVHREVSSATILVSDEGKVKLTGFGLAKSAADPALTRAGTVMGWLEYMSPEQAMATSVDARSDIYSAGAVLYEMVTGHVPFYGKSEFDLMRAHVSMAPVPPRDINPLIPHELNQTILTALAKNPSERFQTVRDFREALERACPAAAPSLRHPEISPSVIRKDLPRLVLTGVLTFMALTIAFVTCLKLMRFIM
jgi:serine/threonine-protein kinase